MLRASGYRTGLFTSPHLCDIRERFRIQGCACCDVGFICTWQILLCQSSRQCLRMSEQSPMSRKSVSQGIFMKHFWPLYSRLEQLATDEVPKPAYFRFLTLLGRMPAPSKKLC